MDRGPGFAIIIRDSLFENEQRDSCSIVFEHKLWCSVRGEECIEVTLHVLVYFEWSKSIAAYIAVVG